MKNIKHYSLLDRRRRRDIREYKIISIKNMNISLKNFKLKNKVYQNVIVHTYYLNVVQADNKVIESLLNYSSNLSMFSLLLKVILDMSTVVALLATVLGVRVQFVAIVQW